MGVKILLDTDIGTDSDDAVCLAYLLAHPQADLLGVTTVGRDATLRADIAAFLCRHFGRPDLPVAAGVDTPILPNPYWHDHIVNQIDVTGRPARPRPSRPQDALELMAAVIRAHPGQVVLVTVGFLSNLALLALTDLELCSKLKAVYTMGGRFLAAGQAPRPECNMMLDPAAALATFARTLPQHTVVPVNITGRLALGYEAMTTLFAGAHLDPVRRCCEAWIATKKSPGTGLHDPFTAACILDPSFCTWEQGRIGVRFQDHLTDGSEPFGDSQTIGITTFEPAPDGPHTLAVGCDRERYRTHLSEIFGAVR